MNIPGKVNGGLPDSTLHYVPFTYAGTIEAYKLTSEMATTEEYAQQNKYAHSLFVADYAVTHDGKLGCPEYEESDFRQKLCQRRRGLYPARTVCGK